MKTHHRSHRPGFRRLVQGSLASVVAVTSLLTACSPEGNAGNKPAASPTPIAVPPPADPAVAAKGAKLYSEYCANCHYDGAGNRGMPALRGSAVVAAPPTEVTKVILKGQRGVSVVNGQKVNAYMPGFDYLPDDEIAAIVMHLRRKFAGVDEKWTAADVKGQR